jgi:hypothetical protein
LSWSCGISYLDEVFLMTTRAYTYSLVLTLLAAAANAGIGLQHTIPALRAKEQATLFDAAFDGTSYLVAYTTAAGLRVRRIPESDDASGAPLGITADASASSPAIGSNGRGLSLVAWLVPSAATLTHAALQMAWIDPSGAVGNTFTVSPDVAAFNRVAVATVGDRFLVAWSDAKGLNLSSVQPGATSFANTERIAEYGSVWSLVTNGSSAVLAWNVWEEFACGIPEGCFVAILHLSIINSDGRISWSGEPADLSGTPLPPLSADVFVLNGPAAVVRSSAGGAAIWYIRGGTGAAVLDAQIYAMRMRALFSGMRDLYFGASGANSGLEGEYRYTHTGVIYALVPYTRLIAGVHTLLAIEHAVTDFDYRDELAYRIIDLTAPFPPLPSAPDAITVTPLVPSPTRASWWQATIHWPVSAGVQRYVVETEPLSDPYAQYFIGPVPGTVGEGIINSFESDVLYALRVYAENADGISRPAEYLVRTPAAPTPRSAIDFSASAVGDVATFRWRDVSSNESGFRITVCSARSGCTAIASTGPDATSVTANLVPGWYTYALETFNAAGSTFAQRHIPINVAVPRRRASR